MFDNKNNSWRRGFSFSVIMVGVLAILVPLLAFLQYRWIGEVAEFEREQLQQNLARSHNAFVGDIQREFILIPREFRAFRPDTELSLDEQFVENYDAWLTISQQPDLIRNVYLVDRISETESRWRRFDPESGTLGLVEPLGRLYDELPFLPRPDDSSRLIFSDGSDSVGSNDEGLWFVIPRFGFWILVDLDADFLWSELVPNLVGTHFDDQDYNVILMDPHTERVLYRSDPALDRLDFAEPDHASGLFSRQDPRLRRGGGRGAPDIESRRSVVQVRQGGRSRRGNFDVFGGDFQLLAQHRAGSLEGAVEDLRQRNLVVGFGILALLAATGAMIIVWAERVRAVGRLQMEFAAGISHELRTPLATIRTAAHNIAAGIVKQPEQIREYAGIVQTEGRRLSAMVDQVIQFAQTEAGRRSYNLAPTDVGHVIDQATATLEDANDRIQTHIETDLPPALADETALTHCVGNLLANALKFGPENERIVVDARYDIHTNRVLIGVENGGPAIESADLPHVFEPFYRGRNVGKIPGSGLGLSLVQRMIEGQKGRVTVSSEPEVGTVFTLHIPAVSQPDPSVSDRGHQ